MKPKPIVHQVKLAITIHREADVQKAVTQIHLAAQKAGRGGQVAIEIIEAAPKAAKPAPQVHQDRSGTEKPAEVPAQAQTKPQEDPGAQEQVPERVLAAQDKMSKGKIPTAKERKALEEWEARNA